MDELPMELYEEIFDNLHLIDLARLRRVCKRLRSAVKEYRIRELVISSPELAEDTFICADGGVHQNSMIIRPRKLKRTIPYLIHKISSKNSLFDPYHFYHSALCKKVDYSTFSAYELFLRSGQFNVHFLKSLTFNYSDMKENARYPARYIEFDEVNKLLLLERLEINFDYCKLFDSNFGKLSLPNLRTLLLNYNNDRYFFKLEVEAPKCEGFHLKTGFAPGTNPYLRVHFGDPHSVKYLSLHKYNESSQIFKNIEFLQISESHFIDKRTFAAFPHLKSLKILKHYSLEEGLEELFELCRQHNVRLVFHGIQLNDSSDLDAFEENDFKTDELCFKPNYATLSRLLDHYERLEDDLNFVTEIVVTERAAPAVYRLLEADASRFLRKFSNLIYIRSVTRIERPELLLQLLTSCNCLMTLHIENSGLPQPWFEQLTNIRTLVRLKVKEETKVDLSFVCKMRRLDNLTTNHHVDLKQEIKLDELVRLRLHLELDEIDLSIYKDSWSHLHNGVMCNYTLFKKKRGYDIRTERPHIENLPSFELLARRYEEIRNELDNSSRTARESRQEASEKVTKNNGLWAQS